MRWIIMADNRWSLVFLVFSTHFVVSDAGRKCGAPPVYPDTELEDRFRVRNEFNDGQTVRYKCPRGYTGTGSRTSTCEDGRWSPLEVQCKRKPCGSAGEILNGRFRQDGNVFGNKAYAECNEGYVLIGDPVRECLVNGWNGTVPSCVASDKTANCSHPSNIPNATFHETKATYKPGDTVSYYCKEGYQLTGNTNVLTCEGTGNWSSNLTNCQRIQCEKFTIANSANVKFGDLTSNTKVNIACQAGYRLKGPSVVTCGANSSWTPSLPTCAKVLPLEVTCPPPVVPNSSRQNRYKTRYEVGEPATISCQEGFELIGSSQVTCGTDSSWTPSLPTCEEVSPVEVTCPPPVVPNSSRQSRYKMEYDVGERAIIFCEEGFKLIGSSQVTCGADGQWKETPECRLTGGKCPPPPFFPNAYTEQGDQNQYEPGTTVRFRCNPGYRMIRGPSTVYCRNGRWTDLETTCEKKKCGSAGEIENGRFSYTGSSFGDTATARCNHGYRLVGVGVRHCRANGWDGRVPVCEVTQCPEPPTVPDADVFYDTSGIIKNGYVASYTCHYGRLIGQSEIICTENGTWSAPAPRCEVFCPNPNVKSGSIVAGSRGRYQPGNSVTFKCAPGWRLSGPDVITCGRDGYWNPRLPQCVYRFS